MTGKPLVEIADFEPEIPAIGRRRARHAPFQRVGGLPLQRQIRRELQVPDIQIAVRRREVFPRSPICTTESRIRCERLCHGQRGVNPFGPRRLADIQLSVTIPFNGNPDSFQPERPDPDMSMKQGQELDPDLELVRRSFALARKTSAATAATGTASPTRPPATSKTGFEDLDAGERTGRGPCRRPLQISSASRLHGMDHAAAVKAMAPAACRDPSSID